MRLLSLSFELPLQRRDIAGFRAAVARAAGYEADLFHNHREDGSVQYRYPLVQYRSERGNAAIVGIDEGGDAIYKWYTNAGNRLLWNDAEHDLRILRLDVHEYAIRYHDTPRSYRLRQWLALNQTNYRDWQALPDLKARATALDRILVANILTFCRAVGWRLPERLEAGVQTIAATRRTPFIGFDMIGFDVDFSCNLLLPTGIGLGKAVSHGYGVCSPVFRRGQQD
jgi:hypothetical protein